MFLNIFFSRRVTSFSNAAKDALYIFFIRNISYRQKDMLYTKKTLQIVKRILNKSEKSICKINSLTACKQKEKIILKGGGFWVVVASFFS